MQLDSFLYPETHMDSLGEHWAKLQDGILTPHVIAGANSDLTLYNYGAQVALQVSNANAKVSIPVGLALGGGGIAEAGAGSGRALTLTHDVAKNSCVGRPPSFR